MAFIHSTPFGERYVRVGQPQHRAHARRRDPDQGGDGQWSISPDAEISVYVYTYKNQEARYAGDAPIEQEFLTWKMVDLDLVHSWTTEISDVPVYEVKTLEKSEIYQRVYDAVKAMPAYGNAVDELTFSFPG